MSKKLRVGIGVSSFGVSNSQPLEILENEGFEIVSNPYGRRLTEVEISEFIQGLDGLIAGLEPLNRTVLSHNPDLKALARVGIGTDNVDHEAAKGYGIKVSNTPDGPTEAVAEAVLTYLLTLLRRVPEVNLDMHQGNWTKKICKGLRNLPITVIGFGRIGRHVAKTLSSLGASISVVDPFLQPETGFPYAIVDLEAGLKSAEVITLHASGTDTIIGEEEFESISKGSILLNAARGSLVDESALISALDSDRLAGVWFDTFWEEPYKGPLIGHPKALLSPHLATFTTQCRLSMECDAANNLIEDLRNSVS